MLESRFAENEKVALDGAPEGISHSTYASPLFAPLGESREWTRAFVKVTQLSGRTISGNMARCGNSEADKSRPMLDLKRASAPSYARIAY